MSSLIVCEMGVCPLAQGWRWLGLFWWVSFFFTFMMQWYDHRTSHFFYLTTSTVEWCALVEYYYVDNTGIIWCLCWLLLLYPKHNKVVGEYIRFTPCVRLSRIPCPLCSAYSSGWIHFIFIHYQATSEGVSRVKFLAKFQNWNFWHFFLICSFDFVLFWLGIWCESLVWVIMGRRGVSQSAGILVVLVIVAWILYLIVQYIPCTWFAQCCSLVAIN